jgi:hypothetical protein
VGRSGNPAKRAVQKGAPPVQPKRRRCYYCGSKTSSDGESTQEARFPHAQRRQTWDPICEVARKTRLVQRRLRMEALGG